MMAPPETLGDTLRRSCETFADRTALMLPSKNGYDSVTYRELGAIVRRWCYALQSLGLKRGDRVALQSENCAEWAYLDWASQCLGIAIVPIYPTLPKDQARFIATDAQVALCVANGEEQFAKLEGLPAPVKLLKDGPESLATIAESGSMDEAQWNSAIDSTSPSDLATLIYTSGTTGNPKGVMLLHRSPTFLNNAIQSSLPIDCRDVFFSFLPLSHVFERYAGHWLPISCGASIAYLRNHASMAADLAIVKPTIMLVVPRFLDALRDRVLDSLKKQSGLKRTLFSWTVSQGAKRARGGFAPLAPLLDKLVAAKVRARVGGRLRAFVAGGAALPGHLYEFWASFGIRVLQGYGLTETCAGSCLNPFEGKNKYWTVGPPIPGVEVQIAADGEILIKGPTVMEGYYNLPEETAKAIDAEGWFHTGDIGKWDGDCLKITDRKKDLIVLGNGKNVAPQPIENRLKESSYIAEAVLFGDGSDFIVALVIPHFEHLQSHLQDLGLTAPDHARMIELEPVKQLIKGEIDRINKSLADFERVKRHVLINAAFSVETGELTPSMKVKRKVVKERYEEDIRSMLT